MVAANVATAYGAVVITPPQIRAARALLGWKQSDLASRSGVSEISVKNIERGATDPRSSTLTAIQRAFAEAGVVFIDTGSPSLTGGHGVRLEAALRQARPVIPRTAERKSLSVQLGPTQEAAGSRLKQPKGKR